MNDKAFIDTNIWLYLYSTDEPKKKNLAQELITRMDNIVISTQVLNELTNVLHKKFKLKPEAIKLTIHEIVSVASLHIVDLRTIQLAISVTEKYHYSYFDSLMIASALTSECSLLYSEDMHNSQLIQRQLKIINPLI